MKTNILVLFAILATVFYSCKKDPSTKEPVDYSKLVTIKQGLWGSCAYLTGDCELPVNANSCKSYPVKRTIYIYTLTFDSQAVRTTSPLFYNQINTQLIAQTQSDENGFYQIALLPGQYSLFIFEQNKYYCISTGGQLQLGPVTVGLTSPTRCDLVIDMAVH
jgi:hypothetical protein